MKLALSALLSLTLVGAVAREARADDDEAAAIAAAKTFWGVVGDWGTPAASKKAPIHYVIDSNHAKCKKHKVGKATAKKQADKLSLCVTNTYLSLIPAEIDFTPTETGWEVTSEPYEMLFNKKQQKAIATATKNAVVVSNTFAGQDNDEFVQVFIAVRPGGKVTGIFIASTVESYD